MIRSRSAVSSRSRSFLLGIVLALLLGGLIFVCPVTSQQVEASTPEVGLDTAWGDMPLYFIANQGQLDEAVSYYVQGSEKILYFTEEGLTFSLGAGGQDVPSDVRQESWTLRLDYLGAEEVTPQGQEKTEAIISYFQGAEEDWNTGISTYSRICYPGLWEGVDLLYSGTQDELKQEFLISPGADPDQIRLSYQGASVTLNAQGELEISTPVGGFTDSAPVAYQEVDGQRVEIPVSYAVGAPTGSGVAETTTYGFLLGDYDLDLPLVIDPTYLVYCGYIGGTNTEHGRGIAVDSSGCAYVTGDTYSNEDSFPVTTGSHDVEYGGNQDTFVAKVSADGTSLVYCTYLGGEADEIGYGIAVDSSGCAYVTGYVVSSTAQGFPASGFDTSFNGSADAFVAKVSADGTALSYCTYLGGEENDWGWDIAVDSSGCAYVTGETHEPATTPTVPFPVTTGSLDETYNGGDKDGFVAKVSADGSSLDYCGYLGGSVSDSGWGIAVDSSGCAYVTGDTNSNQTTEGFPVTSGSLDETHNGGIEAYVAKVSDDGSGLDYCGYIGGSVEDRGYGIAVDSSGCAYVTGSTYTTHAHATPFPVTTGSLDETHNGGNKDAFVAKVNSSGAALDYCGYIGGTGTEDGYGIAVDSSGCAYVTGSTYSAQDSFPVVDGPDTSHNGGNDAFVAKVSADGTALAYCGYIGGNTSDIGNDIAVLAGGDAYVAGSTLSTQGTFPETSGSLDEEHNGQWDAFVAKIGEVAPTVTGLSPDSGPTTGGTSVTITGTDFTGTTAVTFGGTTASFTVGSGTQITATSPAHVAGTVRVQVTTAYGSTADTSADDFTYYTQPTSLTRYEQDNSNLYYQGRWTKNVYSPYAASGWSYSYANGAASLNVAFTGTSLDWITRTTPWSGIAKVVLDAGTANQKVKFVDTWHWTDLHKQKVYSTGTLAYGPHTVSIYWTGLKRYSSWYHQIYTDAFDIKGKLTKATVAPALGLKKVDDKNTSYCTYSPDWSHWDNSGYWAAYMDTYAFTDKKGDKLTVTFKGNYLSWVAMTSNTKGKAKVTVDGGTPKTVDLYSPTTLWKRSVFSTGILAYGTHTVVIECLREKRSYSWWYTIDADRFDIL